MELTARPRAYGTRLVGVAVLMAVPNFPFTESFGDARVEELKLLSWAAQHGKLSLARVPSGPWHDLLIALVSRELLTAFSFEEAKESWSRQGLTDLASPFGMPGDTPLIRAMALSRVKTLCDLYEKRSPIELWVTHLGRVRVSELKQSLRAGREREPFEILWDGRHWERDVQIAILDTNEGSPLSLAYMDMNGLKQINDTYGHDAGDLALRAYFQAVASSLGDGGQAYRLSGGADEVVAILPNHDQKTAVQIARLVCTKLMNDRLWPMDPNALLSIAVGIVSTTDPTSSPASLRYSPASLRYAADQAQKRAKSHSKQKLPRPSVIAIDDDESLVVLEPDPHRVPVKIVGSYFRSDRGEGIMFTVMNSSDQPLPPYKIGLFHPKLGSYFLFPSEKTGQLLPDQKRDHKCLVVQDAGVPQWFPKLTHGSDSQPLGPDDDGDFQFQLVLEDSDHKVLFADKRIGRSLAALMRKAVQSCAAFGRSPDHWSELTYPPY
jgi:diguanylate cyclase (GGDEF)-like protein